jgi:hypothetical protein
MRALAFACCAWLSMGCSFIFVRPPPSDHPQLTYFDCVSSDVAPAVDTTNAAIDGLFAVAASVDHLEGSEPGVVASLGIAGAVYAASAIYGFAMTSQCARAKEQLADRVLKTRAERDQLLQAQSQHPALAGCQRDLDCKGTRVCANAACVEPPSASVAQPPAAPAEPSPAPTEPAPPATPAPTRP